MSAIIAILKDKTIIDWSPKEWTDAGTYTNPVFWNVLFDCPEGKRLDRSQPLGDLGSACSHGFDIIETKKHAGQGNRQFFDNYSMVVCDQCYKPEISQIPLEDIPAKEI